MPNNQGVTYKTMSVKNILIILPILIVFALVGCNKEPEYIPGQGIQGIREPIFRILLSPVAYDGAIVVVEGVVRDYEQASSEDGSDNEATFKLFDSKGNYINIVMPGEWEIVDNDYLIVGGIYRNNTNIIDAQQFEKVEFKELEDKDIEKEIEKRDDW
ncbi:MAG: hypothetical protein AAF462_08380 [Thermodesulfobacteriota bacterium]